MALTDLIRINGETLDDLGIDTVSSPPLGYVGVERDLHGIPGSLGAIPGTVGVGAPKMIPLRLVLGATTIENRQGELDTLFAKLGGLLELEFGFATDRIYWGYADGLPMRPRFDSIAYIGGDAVIALNLVVPRGVSVSRDPAVLHIATAVTDIVGLGELPSAPVFIVHGAVTDLTIDYQDQNEVTIRKLTLTGTIAADEYAVIDSGTQRIVIVNEDTGVQTLTMSFFDHTVSNNGFPIFDPRDGVNGQPPMIQSSVPCTAYFTGNYP